MNLSYINRENALIAWPDIEPLIAKVSMKYDGTHPLTVLGCILKGEYMCFVATEGREVRAVATVEIFVREAQKYGKIVHVAGEGREGWLKYLDDICEWCKAQGCIAVEGIGRVGWEKVLAEKGFKRTSTIIRKHL